ncbi:MAG TPA: NAD(P)/FAD-dependent oxidoreductase [Candidatus Binataceae bacterium]|nr:NAD(P)/FAD-dependent oxidoreductase [Candidatus Binataceae bacterium]
MEKFDAVVVGAGAAGLMCALTAGQRGRRVCVLEHGPQVGAKILISGGGRCNFTNREVSAERFLSVNPHFCKSALSRYTPSDFIALVERHGIAYHEKTLGQLFCDGSARQIVEMLLHECAQAGVEIRLNCALREIVHANGFCLATARGALEAAALVIATGGLSIPKLGASGFAYDVARRFGLRVIEPRAGLVPLRVEGEALALCQELAGVSLEISVSCGRQAFRENLLFTHRGVSGPAILQISSYWQASDMVRCDLLPDVDSEAWLKDRKRSRPAAELKTVLAEMMPARLARALVALQGLSGPMASLSDRDLQAFARRLKRFPIRASESEGWAKAEVTVGGVDTAALSSRTMAVREVPGLYFIGEAVDVTGWLGGYNFQWAWASGWCAGQAV